MKNYILIVLLTLFTRIVPLEQLPIIILITTYNNVDLCLDNIQSALSQHYDNVHIICIDDCSTDGTTPRLQQWLTDNNMLDRVTFISNSIRRGALHNIWRAVHNCPDECIIVSLDGDDMLPNPMVLQRINYEYQTKNIWMTYGQYKNSADDTIGFCVPMPAIITQQNNFRNYTWITSHPRTFKAWLFKQVKLQDLLFDGTFMSVAWDLAFMFPLLEMAGFHCAFIPDILYIYNNQNPTSDGRLHGDLQQAIAFHIRLKPKYTPLAQQPTKSSDTLDYIIINTNQKALNLKAVNQTNKGIIQKLSTFNKQNLYAALQKCPHDWVMIIDNDIILDSRFDVNQALQTLKSTHAFGCYLLEPLETLKPLPPLLTLEHDCYVWKFNQGMHCWMQPTITASIHAKKTLLALDDFSDVQSANNALAHLHTYEDIALGYTIIKRY